MIQVPDFGDRFWVYQIVDVRTDSFADVGKMYGTTPGFYLLVGPDWKEEVPKGITGVFRASTNTGYVVPRVFQDDTPEDNKAVQVVTRRVMMYPLAEFDDTMKKPGLDPTQADALDRERRPQLRRCSGIPCRVGRPRAGRQIDAALRV